MDNTIFISICYLNGGIRLFKDTIRDLDMPSYVKIYIHREQNFLAIISDEKQTLITHKIPKDIYDKRWKMIIYSKKLCNIIYEKMQWDKRKLYRVPGKIIEKGFVACFELNKVYIAD